MKSEPIKCILEGEVIHFYETPDAELKLLFVGKYVYDMFESIQKNKITRGGPLEITIDKVNTSKTVKQNNTFHDLLKIYWKSGYPSDQTYGDLKIRIKDTYGVRHEIRVIAGEKWKVLKSWSKYTLAEGRRAIDGLISEMQSIGVNDKRFGEMIDSWNDYKVANPPKIKPEPKEELEIF